MNMRDHEKLNRAGYMILKERDIRPVRTRRVRYYIFATTMNQNQWHRFGLEFKTREARANEIRRLCESEYVLED